jgi:ABC-type multidrug transport system ATPase subunit
MNRIVLDHISKRFDYQWIVKDITYTFSSDVITGITGSNGSGKSTLLKIISGYLSPSNGKIEYYSNKSSAIHNDDVYKHVALAGPYTDVIQEYTLKEMYDFHQYFKPLIGVSEYKEFLDMLQLPPVSNKTISQFSSGMKQKIQIALALLSDTEFLLLDEPTSFLDDNAKQWFVDMLMTNRNDRCVIIASNDRYDLDLCDKKLEVRS